MVQNLVHDVVDLHDYHLTTGNVCTKYLLEALAANGHIDVALKLATQTTYPSWGYMLDNGATTLWERWEKFTQYGMNSHDHPMMGSIGSWVYKVLAGINITPETAGFDRFVLRPQIVDGLDHVEAKHQTVRGAVKAGWQRADGRVVVSAGIPANCAAEVVLPAAGEGARILAGDTCVWEGGKPANQTPGVAYVGTDAGSVTFLVGSGDYEFSVENKA